MFLRAIARPLMARVKQTTGIVGLDVVPNAREVLIELYSKTLTVIEDIPEGESYWKGVESRTRERLQVCREEDDWEVIEKRLGCGQVEELIEEARVELTVIGNSRGFVEFEGLGVVPNAREILIELYSKTLTVIEDIPEDVFYRKAVERATRERLQICREVDDWEVVKKRLSVVGGREEPADRLDFTHVDQARAELTSLRSYIELNLWRVSDDDECEVIENDVPDDYECEVIENDAPVPKHVPIHRPGPLPEQFYQTLEGLASGQTKLDEIKATPIESKTEA